jgi:hypothetical protein
MKKFPKLKYFNYEIQIIQLNQIKNINKIIIGLSFEKCLIMDPTN